MSDQSESNNPIDPLTIGDLMSLIEAAEKTEFSAVFLRELAAKGRIRAKRTGSIWLTTVAAIEEYKKTRHRGKRTDLDKQGNSL
jgi:hypothetical protein